MNRFFKIFASNIIIFLIGILALELLFGGWIGRNYGTLVIPVDFNRRFDVSKLYQWKEGRTNYARDIYGLRGHYKSLSNIDILTVGGSTTNEIFISEGYTWSDVLRKNFEKEKKDFTVINAGVDGQSTIGHLKNFELWFPMIPEIKARYILVYIGINDHALIKANYNQNKQDGLLARRNIFKQYVMNNSAFYTLFRNIRGMVFARRANLIHTGHNFNQVTWKYVSSPQGLKTFEEKYADDLNRYANRLIKLNAAIHKFGSKPIFVTQHKANYKFQNGKVLVPNNPTEKSAFMDFVGLTAINKVTMQTCRELEAICIDLGQHLLFSNGDHYDDIHTTPQGSKKIGDFLFKALKRNSRFN